MASEVLVVDDNRTNRRILEGMLGRWEMKTDVGGGRTRGVGADLSAAAMREEPFGLILTDMHMPKMDGFTLIEHIRHRPELATATIMMLTSAGHRGDAARCQELGVSAYLLKPIRQSELREAIARVLGARARSEGAIPLITRFSLHDARDPSGLLACAARGRQCREPAAGGEIVGEARASRGGGRQRPRSAGSRWRRRSSIWFSWTCRCRRWMDSRPPRAIREKEKSSGLHQPIIALTAHAMKG